MKQISLVMCTLILAVTGAQAQSPSQADSSSWRVYTVNGEEFSVALPTLPSMHTSKEMRDRPKKDRRRRVLGTSADGVTYIIYAFENSRPRQSLDEFIRGQMFSKPASDLTSERSLTINGIAGKEFVYPDRKGMVQFFATEDRLYDFRAYGASVDDFRISKFFSSLSLKKTDQAIEVSDGPGLGFESADTSDTPYTGKEIDTKALLKVKPEPTYTDSAERNRTTGTVVLRCVFTSKGTVTNIRVISGLPNGLTEKAIEAARKIKFVPAMKDGRYVSMWMQLEYNFDLAR